MEIVSYKATPYLYQLVYSSSYKLSSCPLYKVVLIVVFTFDFRLFIKDLGGYL